MRSDGCDGQGYGQTNLITGQLVTHAAQGRGKLLAVAAPIVLAYGRQQSTDKLYVGSCVDALHARIGWCDSWSPFRLQCAGTQARGHAGTQARRQTRRAGGQDVQRGRQRSAIERTSLSNTLKALTMSFVGVVSVKPSMTFLKSAKATSFFPPIGSSALDLCQHEKCPPLSEGVWQRDGHTRRCASRCV